MPNLPTPAQNTSVAFAARYPQVGRGAVARQFHREVERLDAGTELRIAQVQAAADVETAKVDAVASVGHSALQRVTVVAMTAQQLAMACPAAAGDLDFIKSLTVMQVGQIVSTTQQALRRL